MTDATTTPETTNRNQHSRKRNLLLGGGVVVGAVALLGGGIAIGANIETDDDSDEVTASSETGVDTNDTDSAETEAETDAATVATGAATSAELLDIINTASAQSEGSPVAIEATGDNEWSVQFVGAKGEETEVRVDASGSATVLSTEPAEANDTAPKGSLDAATLESAVAAALAEHDGTVLDVEIDDDTTSPYDVTVLTADKKTVDVALDASFAVVAQ